MTIFYQLIVSKSKFFNDAEGRRRRRTGFFYCKGRRKRGRISNTAEPAYSRLQGIKEYCLLKEKSTITGIE